MCSCVAEWILPLMLWAFMYQDYTWGEVFLFRFRHQSAAWNCLCYQMLKACCMYVTLHHKVIWLSCEQNQFGHLHWVLEQQCGGLEEERNHYDKRQFCKPSNLSPKSSCFNILARGMLGRVCPSSEEIWFSCCNSPMVHLGLCILLFSPFLSKPLPLDPLRCLVLCDGLHYWQYVSLCMTKMSHSARNCYPLLRRKSLSTAICRRVDETMNS